MDDISILLRDHDELRKVAMENIGQIVQVAPQRLKKYQRQRQEQSIVDGGESSINSTTTMDEIDSDNESKHVVVANNHLYYHQMVAPIRAMRAYVICKKIDEICR